MFYYYYFKDNLFLSLYAWSKIPLIGFCAPRVLESSGSRTVLKIPLGFRTKNHLGAMYFGALAIGGELCVAMLAVKLIQESGLKIDFVFKDFKAEFLKTGLVVKTISNLSSANCFM